MFVLYLLNQISVIFVSLTKLVDVDKISCPIPRPRGSARRKTASSLILRGHF